MTASRALVSSRMDTITYQHVPVAKMPHNLLCPGGQPHVRQMPLHLLRRLPRQPLAYPTYRNRAGIRTRRKLRFYLRATRVVDGRTHGCYGGVRTLEEELDAAIVAWAEPVAVAENMVRIAPCSEPLPGYIRKAPRWSAADGKQRHRTTADAHLILALVVLVKMVQEVRKLWQAKGQRTTSDRGYEHPQS